MSIAFQAPIVFRFGHCINIRVQQDSLSGKVIFALQKHSKVSSSSTRWLYTFLMAGGEKSIGKALLLVGFLSYLDSRTIQTQADLLGKNGPPFTSLHDELRVGHRQTNRLTQGLTDGRGAIKVHGTSRRLRLLF